MSKQWRLPKGGTTTDVEKFHKKWDVYLDFVRSKGFRVISYCPGVTVVDGNRSFSFPVWVLDRMMNT